MAVNIIIADIPCLLMLCVKLSLSMTLLILCVEQAIGNFGGRYINLNDAKSV